MDAAEKRSDCTLLCSPIPTEDFIQTAIARIGALSDAVVVGYKFSQRFELSQGEAVQECWPAIFLYYSESANEWLYIRGAASAAYVTYPVIYREELDPAFTAAADQLGDFALSGAQLQAVSCDNWY